MAGVDQLRELEMFSEGVEEFASGSGDDSLDGSIEDTLERLMENEILDETRIHASEYVGGYASEIDVKDLGWMGQEYSYGLGSDSVVVDSHEYGTGKHNEASSTDSFDGRVGYRIPAESEDGPIVVDGNVVEYVVHPGVEPKHFMRSTVRSKTEDISDELGEEVADALRDQLGI